MVTEKDLRTFSRACETLYSPGIREDGFAARAVAFLREMVAADVYCVGDLQPATGQLQVDFSEPGEQFRAALEGFGRTMSKYPLFNWDPTVNGGKPFFRRDFYTVRQFRDLDIYAESFSHAGWLNHAAVHVPGDGDHRIFLGLERGGGADYSERDRLILGLAQTHLANALALVRSLGSLRKELPPAPALLASRGFSPREAEVLVWLIEGKTNTEIAMLMKIAVVTVKYHLRSIYNKLGTDNRLAATLHALDILKQHEPRQMRCHYAVNVGKNDGSSGK